MPAHVHARTTARPVARLHACTLACLHACTLACLRQNANTLAGPHALMPTRMHAPRTLPAS
eukprot:1398090-Alexandrium_andersonii.AAC.1